MNTRCNFGQRAMLVNLLGASWGNGVYSGKMTPWKGYLLFLLDLRVYVAWFCCSNLMALTGASLGTISYSEDGRTEMKKYPGL